MKTLFATIALIAMLLAVPSWAFADGLDEGPKEPASEASMFPPPDADVFAVVVTSDSETDQPLQPDVR